MHGGIIHCFSYSWEIARQYISMGLYLGIGGVVTYKNGKKLKEVVECAPLTSLVLETDCPYLSPVPYRGKRNSSRNLSYVVEEIARLQQVSPQRVIDVTAENARRLLKL
jgi:TatD DNase family protein